MPSRSDRNQPKPGRTASPEAHTALCCTEKFFISNVMKIWHERRTASCTTSYSISDGYVLIFLESKFLNLRLQLGFHASWQPMTDGMRDVVLQLAESAFPRGLPVFGAFKVVTLVLEDFNSSMAFLVEGRQRELKTLTDQFMVELFKDLTREGFNQSRVLSPSTQIETARAELSVSDDGVHAHTELQFFAGTVLDEEGFRKLLSSETSAVVSHQLHLMTHGTQEDPSPEALSKVAKPNLH